MYGNSFGFFLIFLTALLLAVPMGAYMKQVYNNEKNILDFLLPVENWIFKICRIDAAKSMDWKQYLGALLTIHLLWVIPALFVLMVQGILFFNPAQVKGMEWSLAFNSVISFLTSTNLQHYSGETGASYLSQLAVFTFLQFLSAAISLSAGVAIVRGLTAGAGTGLGNFFNDFLKSCTRIFLPLSIFIAILFMAGGMPSNFKAPEKLITLQGDTVTIAKGPVAAMVPIKELGSNGAVFLVLTMLTLLKTRILPLSCSILLSLCYCPWHLFSLSAITWIKKSLPECCSA